MGGRETWPGGGVVRERRGAGESRQLGEEGRGWGDGVGERWIVGARETWGRTEDNKVRMGRGDMRGESSMEIENGEGVKGEEENDASELLEKGEIGSCEDFVEREERAERIRVGESERNSGRKDVGEGGGERVSRREKWGRMVGKERLRDQRDIGRGPGVRRGDGELCREYEIRWRD
ncbi:hypothetical protein Tco_0787819 [Tanacetum coccineum]